MDVHAPPRPQELPSWLFSIRTLLQSQDWGELSLTVSDGDWI